MTRHPVFLLLLLLASACRSPETAAPPASPDAVARPEVTVAYAWVQYTQGRQASARAIALGSSCPPISINAQASVSMTVRAVPAGYSGFGDITVCEYPLSPPDTQLSITSTGQRIRLPAPNWQADHVLVVGDTGCRLKGSAQQWCEGGSLDRGGWGFPKLSLAAASGSAPDLILHVGDYLYRESRGSDGQCVPNDPARGWEYCGDDYRAWEADFFAPAHGDGAGLLARAPWIFVRGNHETCSRAWQGYFLFFADGPAPDRCGAAQEAIAPYAVQLDPLDIHVVDTSNESSTTAQQSFETVVQHMGTRSQTAWLTTHVPTADLVPAYGNSGLAQITALRWIHVGHVHHFQHTPATAGQQAETVTGGSGTALDRCDGVPACTSNGGDPGSGCCYGKVSGHDDGEYSFLHIVYDQPNARWQASLHDVDGEPVHAFSVSATDP